MTALETGITPHEAKMEHRREIVSKEQLRQRREVVAEMPSGAVVKIRPINLEHHILSGGLPSNLRAIAAQGLDALQEQIVRGKEDGDWEILQYLDGIVARLFVEPEFDPPVYASPADVETARERAGQDPGAQKAVPRVGEQIGGDVLDDLLAPMDYQWAIRVANGTQTTDGQGRLLWGREPLSRWATFRTEHGCAPDCEACGRVADAFSAPLQGSD